MSTSADVGVSRGMKIDGNLFHPPIVRRSLWRPEHESPVKCSAVYFWTYGNLFECHFSCTHSVPVPLSITEILQRLNGSCWTSYVKVNGHDEAVQASVVVERLFAEHRLTKAARRDELGQLQCAGTRSTKTTSASLCRLKVGGRRGRCWIRQLYQRLIITRWPPWVC